MTLRCENTPPYKFIIRIYIKCKEMNLILIKLNRTKSETQERQLLGLCFDSKELLRQVSRRELVFFYFLKQKAAEGSGERRQLYFTVAYFAVAFIIFKHSCHSVELLCRVNIIVMLVK